MAFSNGFRVFVSNGSGDISNGCIKDEEMAQQCVKVEVYI